MIMSLITSDIFVDGYTRSDGTYVEGHYRSSPNDTVSDNYSTEGNVNPYTDEEGNRDIYDDSYNSADVVTPNGAWDDMPGTSSSKDNTGWIILGAIIGLGLIIAILKTLGKIMFISYLAANTKVVFWTWVMLTIVNQIVFFGACLAPYCILASIPHVSLITLGIMYLSYTTTRDTYDPQTGYNKFGYNKDGYNQHGYGIDGFDKNGYNSQGLDRDGKDRLGKGSIGRFFAGSEHQEKISRMNAEVKKAQECASKPKAENRSNLEIAKAKLQVAKDKTEAAKESGNTQTQVNAEIKKPMSEMDQFFNEPKKEDQKETKSKTSSTYDYDKRMREIQSGLNDYKSR